jgi:lysozyme
MIPRRTLLAGLSGLTLPAMAGCGGRQTTPQPPLYGTQPTRPSGLDAVIDISHGVNVSSFASIRRSNILAIIHKASEGGDWIDPKYGSRRHEAESAGLLWGAYHFGTRQYSGEQQAANFLSAARPGPKTVMALDLEPNDPNPRNTMDVPRAEAFVLTVQRATGRLPMLYTHPEWANGGVYGRRRLSLGQAITPGSILARCDLWLADYREEPQIPYAWSDRGWRLWQYAADERESDRAHGDTSRAVHGLDFCDRNLFAGDASQLVRYWNGRSPTA